MRSALLLTFVAIASVLVAAGATPAAPDGAARSGGTFRVVTTEDVDSLDPALAFTILSWQIEAVTCATLMRFPAKAGPAGVVPVPEAAAGLPRVSRDRRTWVFTVRRGLRFSDGSRLTAANFAAALRRVRDPRMRSPFGSAGFFGDVARVSATRNTLRITLREPKGDLLTRMALPPSCPVPTSLPVDPAGIDVMVASGPYRVVERVAGRQVILARNRFYRGDRVRRPDRIVISVGGTGETNVRTVEQGRADYAYPAVPRPLVPELIQRYGLGRRQLFRGCCGLTFFLWLNTQSPLFRDNVPLRRAVNFALDRAEIVRKTAAPIAFVRTDQLLHPGLPGFVDTNLAPLKGPNLRIARRLARGHLRGRRVVFYSRTGPFFEPQTSIIKFNLERLGLDVEVRSFSTSVMHERAGTRGEPFDIAYGSWVLDYPDPSNVVGVLLAGKNARQARGNLNLAYFDEPLYNRRIAAADRLVGHARFRAFTRLERDILRDRVPVAPLFTSAYFVLFSRRVGCSGRHPWWLVDYGGVCVR